MAVLLQDNFTGTTIDTGKWTETDPNNWISQNNALLFNQPHSSSVANFVNKLVSVVAVSSGSSVLQYNFNWTTNSTQEPIAGIMIWKDNSNYALITTRDDVVGNTYRLQIISGGSKVYDLYDGSTASKGKDVKIVADSTTIKFYYWSGSSWTQMGTTQTVSLGYNRKVVLTGADEQVFSGVQPATFNNLYLSDQDYTTQYPVTATPPNFFPFF